MTDQEMRIAIAEACGWRLELSEAKTKTLWRLMRGDTLVETFHWNNFNGKIGDPVLMHVAQSLPDYLNDLNAMHEAERTIIHSTKRRLFVSYLRDVTADIDVWHATARQRAEAFLKTIGKWK